jgi:rubrerythrin
MAPPNLPNVPQDMWVCGRCKNRSLITLTDSGCPICGHERDGYYSSPGESYSKVTGLLPGYSDYQYPSTRAALPYYPASIDNDQFVSTPPSIEDGYDGEAPMTSYSESPKDLWYCTECGAENHNWCNICGECGSCSGPSKSLSRLSTSLPDYHAPSRYCRTAHTSYGGAGSAVDGYWRCPNCGGSNGPLNDYCADPDCGAAKP